MNSNHGEINEILKELYLIDSSFEQHESELKKLIEKLLLTRPDTQFDDNFKRELKIVLLKRIEEIRERKSVGIAGIFDFFVNPKFSYALSGAVLTLLLLIPIFYYVNKGDDTTGDLTSVFSINSVSKEAFGSLLSGDQGGQERMSAPGLGGGGQEGQISESEVMLVSGPLNYNYVYKGDDLVLDQENVEVLKRKKGSEARSGVMSLINSLDFGIMDLSSFKNSSLEMINFSQDIDFGYTVSINFSESSVSIYENWRKWNQETFSCMGIGCSVPESLQLSDIPGDEKLIEIADNFVREHSISLDMYGAPEVDNIWESGQSELLEPRISYAPQSIAVIYPLLINGLEVYDEWGNKFGLRANINIREMKVSSLHNITSHHYEKSIYAAETDPAEIIKAAEEGGIYGMRFGDSGKIIEIELGTPTSVYMKTWNFQDGETNELLVPAFLFPVTKKPARVSIFQKNVIIPLVRELLNKSGGRFPVPLPEIQN